MVNKKVLIWTLIVFAVLVTIVGVVFWFLSVETIKDSYAKYLGIVGTLMPTLLGIGAKVFLSMFFNKRNIKQLDQHLIDSGIKSLSEIKQSNIVSKNELKDYFHYKDFHFKVSKKKIMITFNEKDEVNNYKELKEALNAFVEKVRSDLSSQLI